MVRVIDKKENNRSILYKETNKKYIYRPQIGDARLECQIILGDLKNKDSHNFYEEVSKIFIGEVTLEPFLYNVSLDGQAVYCSNPMPSTFIISSLMEKM